MKSETFFKITNPDGTAFHDNRTKYAVGKTIKKEPCKNPKLCCTVFFCGEHEFGGYDYPRGF